MGIDLNPPPVTWSTLPGKPTFGTASGENTGFFATAAQGTLAATALQPGGAGTVSADTGWTANADSGSKTASIPSSATLTAMQAALNLVVAGFGDAFVAVSAKTKAIESALVTFKVPNA